jgi:hypothetical protein
MHRGLHIDENVNHQRVKLSFLIYGCLCFPFNCFNELMQYHNVCENFENLAFYIRVLNYYQFKH